VEDPGVLLRSLQQGVVLAAPSAQEGPSTGMFSYVSTNVRFCIQSFRAEVAGILVAVHFVSLHNVGS